MLKKLYYLLAIFLTILAPVAARAEGSKELIQYLGHRPFLEDRNDNIGGIPRRNTIKVYVKAGEVLQLGSSARGIGSGDIIATAPTGQQFSCLTLGNGLIANKLQEDAGPGDGTSDTFIPCSPPPVTAAQEGIWEIQFRSPNSASTTNPSPTLANATSWSQGSASSFVTAWDVTVRNSTGQVQRGRAFANSLALNIGGNSTANTVIGVNSQLFVQTQDGYLYNVNLNGLDPFGFIFFSNKNGFIDASGKPTYRSVEAPSTATNLTNPPSNDDFTHKLFFNRPDTTNLPPRANVPGGGDTWLDPATKDPERPSNLRFFGKEGTENQTGTNPLQGEFKFDVPLSAPAETPFSISIYPDGDDNFTTPPIRVIIGRATPGENIVEWDGKDDNGNDVPPSAVGYRAQVKLYGGEVHFPLIDPESNPNGLIINRLTSLTNVVPGDPTYDPYWTYYDDSGFFNPGPPVAPSPIKLLTGGSSSGGIHKFAGSPGGQTPNSQTNPGLWWGNVRGIDTWAFVPSLPAALNGRIQVLRADLNIAKTLTTQTLVAGGEISYTITVTNNGPSNVTGVRVTDTFPAQIVNPTWTCAITTGTGACPTPSGSGNIDTTVNLNNGAVATFTVTAGLAPTATAPIINSATVTRPNDVADPVDQDGSGGDNITETSTARYETAITPANPRLGIAKQAGTPINNNDGTYTIPYTLVVKNMGNVAINNLQVSDDLSTTFDGLDFSIQSIESINSPGLTVLNVNTSYSGRSANQTLLQGTDSLAVGAEAQIRFSVRITPGSNLGPFNNTARANGTSPGGATVEDDSTDGAEPDFDGDGNPGNDRSPTSVRISGNSNLRLVKRVTRINETPLTGVVDDLNDPNYNAPSWPANYLQGQTNVPDVLPGDEVEYTIYFMSDGNIPANNVRICDRIPGDQTFVPDHFGVGRGSAVQFGTSGSQTLTNADDSDSGTFFPVGTTIDVNLCSGSNTNGALIWNLGNVPSNTNPINYGFVRFRAKVK